MRYALPAVFVPLLFLVACGKSATDAPGGRKGDRAGPPAFTVAVSELMARPLATVIEGVGQIEADEVVEIVARVPGTVETVAFQEGDRVEIGQELVVVEQERYHLAVESARAVLARERSALEDARQVLARREDLARRDAGLLREEELTQARARVAQVQADQAVAAVALKRAELDRHDSRVSASIAGIVQSRSVRTGQWVQSGTVLATLIRRDPLKLRFNVPDSAAGALKPDQGLEFSTGGDFSYRGQVTLVGAVADPATRMVPVVALVGEELNAELRPGAFVRVRARIDTGVIVPVLPLTAVRSSEDGLLAFVVGGDAEAPVAERRVVRLGKRTTDGYAEVLAGLAVGERVVTAGVEALRQGVPLRIATGTPETRAKTDGRRSDKPVSGVSPKAR